MRSTLVLAQTFLDCEEKKEKRHQEVMGVEQRWLQIEEKRNEVNSQGMTSSPFKFINFFDSKFFSFFPFHY